MFKRSKLKNRASILPAQDESVIDQEQAVRELRKRVQSQLNDTNALQRLKFLKTGQETKYGTTDNFGLAPNNPIPTNGPSGTTHYLNRLKTSFGSDFVYQRVGIAQDPTDKGVVDQIEVFDDKGQVQKSLFFDPHHTRRSLRAPDGFRLYGLDAIPKPELIFVKQSWKGKQVRVPGFPHTIIDRIRSDFVQDGIPENLLKIVEQMWRGVFPNLVTNRHPRFKISAQFAAQTLSIQENIERHNVRFWISDRHADIPASNIVLACVDLIQSGRSCELIVNRGVVQDIAVVHGMKLARGDLNVLSSALALKQDAANSYVVNFIESNIGAAVIEILQT